MAELHGEVAKGRKKDYKKEDIMAEEKYKKERKIELKMEESEIPYEDIRYVEKYGLPKKELEELIIESAKFSSCFRMISNYLQFAKNYIDQCKVKECKQSIEIAKYILKGCSE